jgi:Fur family ferric uptake transcriptional regulator
VSSYDPTLVEPLAAALAEDGFVMDVGHLAIFGTCADCSGG